MAATGNLMNYRYAKGILAAVVAVFCVTTSLPAAKGEPVTGAALEQLLTDAENNFSRITTIQTRFTQQKTLSLFSKVMTSTGFCIFKAPDKLRLEYEEPFKSALIVNGEDICKYEFYDSKWQKLNSADKELMLVIMKNITAWLKGRFKDPDVYEISGQKEDGRYVVTLVPKHAEFKKFIRSFELALNAKQNGLDHIIINESQTDNTKIIFHDDLTNGVVADAVFEGSGEAPAAVENWQ